MDNKFQVQYNESHRHKKSIQHTYKYTIIIKPKKKRILNLKNKLSLTYFQFILETTGI